MPRKPSGRPVGRPEKPIDWQQFEQLCALQCTQSEVGSMLKIGKEALSRRVNEHYGEDYVSVYKRFSENGKCSLRRNQFVLSKKNASLAIWLGKIWLGQKDPGIDETKEDALNAIRQAIKEISAEPRIDAPPRPNVEIKQLILDKKLGGETPEVST
jgi:hypothetical protein